MIPEVVLNVLSTGMGGLGSANKDLIPSQCNAKGTHVDRNKNIITIYVRRDEAERLISDFNETGRVAYFASSPAQEAYQFKGEFLKLKELEDNDLDLSRTWRKGLEEVFKSFDMPEENINNYLGGDPDVGIEMEIEKIFNQTPGPNASKEIEIE